MKTIHSFTVAVIIGAIAASPAAAADWSGFYAGIFTGATTATGDLSSEASFRGAPNGYFLSEANADAFAAASTGSLDASAWLAGIEIGGNIAFDPLVIGAVMDVSAFTVGGVQVSEGEYPDPVPGFTWDSETSVEASWLATLRGKVGVNVGEALLYATGGVAFAQVDVSNTYSESFEGDPVGTQSGHSTVLALGTAVGVGADYALTENISIGAEYLHVALPDIETTYVLESGDRYDSIDQSTDLSAQIFKAGVKFHM